MLSNMRIGMRLGLSFAVVLTLLITIVIVAISRINSLAQANERLVNKELADLAITSSMNMEAEAAAIKLLTIVSTSSREARVPIYKEMDSHNNNVDSLLEKLSKNESIPRSELRTITSARTQYKTAFQETVELIELDTESAIGQFSEATRPALENFLDLVNELVESKQAQLISEQNATIEASRGTSTLMIVLGVLALAMGIALALIVSRSITRPIGYAVKVARNIANGEIASQPKVRGNDEVAELMQAFGDMCEGLKSLISSIQDSSGSINTSAQTLRSSVDQVQQGSQNQSDALRHISSVVNEFADETSHAAATAQEAKEHSYKARELAEQGESLIQKATAEFIQISSTISGSAQAVDTLSERAVSVRNLVTTVREIAEQTNLLALNAAIEAARAGETGRGLSVVADEVRGLANRTEQATSEINDVIDAIDSETKVAVTQITSGQKELEQGVAIIQEMVQPLQAMNEGARVSYQQLEQLEQTVNKQAADSASIQQDVTNIDNLANENLNVTNDVCNISSDLTNISDGLGKQVMSFTIK